MISRSISQECRSCDLVAASREELNPHQPVARRKNMNKLVRLGNRTTKMLIQ
jgi:hypothetical protein